jgi:histidinol-phosphate aminotransferase
MAGIRLGIALTNKYSVQQLNKIKPPYNVNILTQERALIELKDTALFEANVKTILEQRDWVKTELLKLPMVLKIFPSDANFVLVRFTDANQYYDLLVKEGIVVRNRSNQMHCENCLRITIGTTNENIKLIQTLKKLG